MLSVFVVAVRVQTVCVAAMTPLIIRVCSTEIEREGGRGGYSASKGPVATVPERVCQNNAACSYLLVFLLGFLDSKRCGTRS